MASEQYEDWLTDFASSALTDEELQTWLDASSGLEKDRTRQLIAEAQCMRWAARILLDRLEALPTGHSIGQMQDSVLDAAILLVHARTPRIS